MKRAFMVAALAGALSMAAVTGVQAQGMTREMAADLMPPHEVSSLVTSMGLRPLGPPVWRGDRYVLFAVDRYGQRVRVVLDAHNGHVLAVRPTMRDAARYPGYGDYRGYGAPPPYGYDQGYAPPPPPGYPQEGRYDPGHHDPQFGAPPPMAVPEAPPIGEDGYFDDDRQEGSLPRQPRIVARGEPAGIPRRLAPVAPKQQTARNIAPMPKPRPPLAGSEVAAPNAAAANQSPPAEAAPQSARPKPGEAIRF